MSRPKRRPAKYPRPLNIPSAPPLKAVNPHSAVAVLLPDSLSKQEALARKSQALRQVHLWAGLRMLCEHYGIPWDEDPHTWEVALLLRLCVAHVPYFRERSPKSKQWDLLKQAWLVHDILEARGIANTRRTPKRTVKGACQYLVRMRRYRGAAVSLESRYKEAIRPKAPLGVLRTDFADDRAFLNALKKILPPRPGTK